MGARAHLNGYPILSAKHHSKIVTELPVFCRGLFRKIQRAAASSGEVAGRRAITAQQNATSV
jgi:hypothetical protein